MSGARERAERLGNKDLVRDVLALVAENNRLREALFQIATQKYDGTYLPPFVIARAALVVEGEAE